MLLVIAVRSRAKDRREACADTCLDGFAPVLVDMDVGQIEFVAIGKLEIPDVESIRLAVLAELRGAYIVAAAAAIGIEIIKRPQRRQGFQGRNDILAYPGCDRLGHRAAHRGRRGYGDFGLIRQDDRVHLHGIDGAAISWSDQNGKRLERRELAQADLAGRRLCRSGCGCKFRKRRVGLLRRRELLRDDNRQWPLRALCAMRGFGRLCRGTILRYRDAGSTQQQGDDNSGLHADISGATAFVEGRAGGHLGYLSRLIQAWRFVLAVYPGCLPCSACG